MRSKNLAKEIKRLLDLFTLFVLFGAFEKLWGQDVALVLFFMAWLILCWVHWLLKS